MGVCELCGQHEAIHQAHVENTLVRVCEVCGSLGRVVPKSTRSVKQSIVEPETVIVQDYAQKIRQAREAAKLTQKEFARQLAEKESVIHKLETGHFRPSLKFAERLHKKFKVNIIEVIEPPVVPTSTKKESTVTIGDILQPKE